MLAEQRGDGRVDYVLMVDKQLWSWRPTLDDQGTQQHCGGAAARDAEHEHGRQSTALSCIIGGFTGYNALRYTGAVLFALF